MNEAARQLAGRLFGATAPSPLVVRVADQVVSVESNLGIGRDVDNELIVTDRRVSRRHCELAVDQHDEVTIRDLGSVNGTFVLRSGAVLEVDGDPVPIQPGDSIATLLGELLIADVEGTA